MSESCVPQARGKAIHRCLTHKEDWTVGEWPDTRLPCPFALAVGDPESGPVRSAPPATNPTTETTPPGARRDVLGTELPLRIEHARIQPSGGSTSTPTSNESASGSLPSKPSEPPSTHSTRRWHQPRTAMEFAAQANRVATMILNGEIDVDTGRLYSSIARTVAQSLSTEVSRARYLQHEPNLTFPEDADELG